MNDLRRNLYLCTCNTKHLYEHCAISVLDGDNLDYNKVLHILVAAVILYGAEMGLLTEGSPLSWEETKKYAQHVREHGIVQFINLYKKLRDREGDVLKWGDEVEYIIVKFLDDKKQAKVSLRGHELLTILNQKEQEDPKGVKSLWRPEYGAYMIEGTPGQPYGGLLAHFNIVEANMRHRRKEASELLNPDEAIMSITSFPRLVKLKSIPSSGTNIHNLTNKNDLQF